MNKRSFLRADKKWNRQSTFSEYVKVKTISVVCINELE